MTRFYCPDSLHALAPVSHQAQSLATTLLATINLDADQLHHAQRVLRLKPGDPVEVFDGKGVVGRAAILGWQNGQILQVTHLEHVQPSQPHITIASAIPKGAAADDMADQLSQVGADLLTPLLTQRSVVDPRPGKLDRFARTAIESARQSGRAYLMQISASITLEQVLSQPYDLKLIAAPQPNPQPNATEIHDRLQSAKRVLILIGPEGGWTDAELHQAQTACCLRWRLGPHVMRIQTAAVAAAALTRCLASKT